MLLSDKSVQMLADTTISKEPAEVFKQWQENTFYFGLINTLIYIAIIAVVTFVIIKLIQHFLARKLSGNAKFFYRLIYVAIIVIAVICVLMMIKPLNNLGTALLASSGIAAVVIGLAAQQTLGNVFSGISISTAKPFQVGEYIEIIDVNPPITGTVKDIGLRHTTILDVSNRNIVIPNSVLDKEVLRVMPASDERNICSFLDIGISYHNDVDLAMKLIEEVIEKHPDTLDVRTVAEKQNGTTFANVRIQDLKEATIMLRGVVWTVDVGKSILVLSDLRYSIKKVFDQNKIEIAQPSLKVTLKELQNQQNDSEGK